MPPEQCLKSHWYWANFWIHKQVRVPEYGSHTRDLFRFRLPSTGPGSLVQILVGSIWVGHMVSPKQFFSKLNNLVISFQTMSPKWCLFVAHVPFLSLLPFWALKNLCCLLICYSININSYPGFSWIQNFLAILVKENWYIKGWLWDWVWYHTRYKKAISCKR